MHGRSNPIKRVLILLVIVVVCTYALYHVHNLQTGLKVSKDSRERMKRSQETLSAQLQVCIEHKNRLELSLQNEKSDHRKAKEDCESVKNIMEEKYSKEKQERMNSFNALNVQHKQLQSINADLEEDVNKLYRQRESSLNEHKQILEVKNEEYMKIKQEKDNEIATLKDSIANFERSNKDLKQQLQTALSNNQLNQQAINQLKSQLQAQQNQNGEQSNIIQQQQQQLNLYQQMGGNMQQNQIGQVNKQFQQRVAHLNQQPQQGDYQWKQQPVGGDHQNLLYNAGKNESNATQEIGNNQLPVVKAINQELNPQQQTLNNQNANKLKTIDMDPDLKYNEVNNPEQVNRPIQNEGPNKVVGPEAPDTQDKKTQLKGDEVNVDQPQGHHQVLPPQIKTNEDVDGNDEEDGNQHKDSNVNDGVIQDGADRQQVARPGDGQDDEDREDDRYDEKDNDTKYKRGVNFNADNGGETAQKIDKGGIAAVNPMDTNHNKNWVKIGDNLPLNREDQNVQVPEPRLDEIERLRQKHVNKNEKVIDNAGNDDDAPQVDLPHHDVPVHIDNKQMQVPVPNNGNNEGIYNDVNNENKGV